MWKIIAAAVATAAAAHGIGFGVGAFGGVALPEGDTAARDGRIINYGPLKGGDAGSSAAWGGKALVALTPALSVELAVAYHRNHGTKHWEEDEWLDEPKLTLVPITLGGRYAFALGAGGVYVAAGGGYFLETLGLVGGGWGPVTIVSHGDVDINAPGAYVAAGAIGAKWLDDAVQVAAATAARASLLLSWNFKHLVDYERIQRFNAVNLANGYGLIDIRSPKEIGHGDNEDV